MAPARRSWGSDTWPTLIGMRKAGQVKHPRRAQASSRPRRKNAGGTASACDDPTMGAAIGMVPHTGWTWLVRVSGEGAVEVRARVVACDVLEGELYHLAAEKKRAAARFVEARRATAVAQAKRALEAHAGGARAAIVIGKRAA